MKINSNDATILANNNTNYISGSLLKMIIIIFQPLVSIISVNLMKKNIEICYYTRYDFQYVHSTAVKELVSDYILNGT